MRQGTSQAQPGAGGAAGPERGLGRDEFAQLYERAHRVLWLIAASVTRRPSLADDVLQDAAALALTKLDDFSRGTNFTAWMAQIVRYVALNMSRRERRRQPAMEVSGNHPDTSTPLAAAGTAGLVATRGNLSADQPHFDDEVMQALESVSETARACLLLRTIENLDYAEISALLQIPQGTAMSHVFRSRATLRARLSGRDPDAGRTEDKPA